MNVILDFRGRVERLQRAMQRAGVDVYVATKQGSLSYLLGAFAPWRTAIVITQTGGPAVLAWSRDAERLRSESWINEFIIWPTGGSGFIATLAAHLQAQGAHKAGIAVELGGQSDRVAPGVLHGFEWLQLRDALPNARLSDGVDLIDAQMASTEPEEVALLRQAGAMADAGAAAALEMLEAGVTETEVAGAAELAMRNLGSEWFWSVTGCNEVGSGHRTGYRGGITQPATTKIIQSGEMVIIDLHPVHRLYFADLCINAIVGQPSAEQRELADTWTEVAQFVVANLRDGMIVDDLVGQALDIVRERGFEQHCVPSFGHGIGTCSRIPPVIGRGNKTRLRRGNAVVAGAHIYQPGVGGMRLELPVVVGDDAGKPLCRTPIALHIVGG